VIVRSWVILAGPVKASRNNWKVSGVQEQVLSDGRLPEILNDKLVKEKDVLFI
jgi:hypothetical protein